MFCIHIPHNLQMNLSNTKQNYGRRFSNKFLPCALLCPHSLKLHLNNLLPVKEWLCIRNHFTKLPCVKNLKIKIYKTVILPVVLYGCETWSLALREEHRLTVFREKSVEDIWT
jgi:hypothetical protein